MKKLIYVLLTAVMAFSFMSCDPKKQDATKDSGTDLIYNVTATAEGQVEFNWFNGGAKVDGNAVVFQCNDTINKVFTNAENDAMLLTQALESNDSVVADAAKNILGLLEVKGVDGNYHLKIVGYVKYGPIILKIDEEYPKVVDVVE